MDASLVFNYTPNRALRFTMNKESSSPRSQFSLPPQQSNANAFSYQDDLHPSPRNMFIDLETVKQQKANAFEMVELEAEAAKERANAEFESNRVAIEMRANHELEIVQVNLEQSRQQSLFSLDQQHAQRKLEIEQRAQEQKLSIETAARQLLLQAQEQRMNKELSEKLGNISRSGSMGLFFSTSQAANH